MEAVGVARFERASFFQKPRCFKHLLCALRVYADVEEPPETALCVLLLVVFIVLAFIWQTSFAQSIMQGVV